MILKSLKEKAIDKIIRRELQRNAGEDASGKGRIESLAIIINYDRLTDFKPLMNLASALSVSDDQVYILGYVDKVHKKVNYLIPVFSEASIKTNGTVKSMEVQEFLGRKYDLLVNFYREPNSAMRLMSALTKASFKAGIAEDMSEMNDLTLLTEENDLKGFREELVKYLKILNKL